MLLHFDVIPGHKCLQSGVWKRCGILARCARTYYHGTGHISGASHGTVDDEASCSVDSISHSSTYPHNLLPLVLQRPLWACFRSLPPRGLPSPCPAVHFASIIPLSSYYYPQKALTSTIQSASLSPVRFQMWVLSLDWSVGALSIIL